MKKLFFILLLLPLLSRADHVVGVDIYYKYVSGNTYRVYMNVYGYCGGGGNFANLAGGTPQINLVDSGQGLSAVVKTFTLQPVPDSVKNVSPYCQAQAANTNCNGGTLDGYVRYVYTDTITLPYASSKWIFRFNSATNPSGCAGRLGRPTTVNNLLSGGGGNIMVDAMLNNLAGNNSSPVFNSSIFTAYCINTSSLYSQTAEDPNNDSLRYALVPALELPGNNCSAAPLLVSYAAGYTYDKPLSVSPGTFSFDNNLGIMQFTANVAQTCVVATKVYEYRNGVMVGYAMREKEFKILSSCSNIAPTGKVDTSALSLSGGVLEKNLILTCPGNILKFTIPLTDANGDTVKATIGAIPFGSTVTLNNNNTKSPFVNFSWNTAGVVPGYYDVICYTTDNGCPFPATGLVKFTIRIVDIGYVATTVMAPTNCIHQAAIQYFHLQNLGRMYTITVKQGNNIIKVYRDSTGFINDSIAAGGYSVKIEGDGITCTTERSFEVKDTGVYPWRPIVTSPLEYCRNAFADSLTGKLTGKGTLKWYNEQYVPITATPPLPATNTAGTFKYYVTEKYSNCESAPDSIYVTIDPKECDYDLHIYNVITPNGDGKNDAWIIENIDEYPKNVVQLFDKVGNKVFEQGPYLNTFVGGTLPSGVYYYLINLNERNKATGLKTYTGYLMIQR